MIYINFSDLKIDRDEVLRYLGHNGQKLDDNMIKLVNKLPNKYSFEERLELLKNAQKIFPENPIFKYYEYNYKT